MLTGGLGAASSTGLAAVMRRLKNGCLPVVEDDRLAGLVSEHDHLAVLEHLPTRSLDERVPR